MADSAPPTEVDPSGSGSDRARKHKNIKKYKHISTGPSSTEQDKSKNAGEKSLFSSFDTLNAAAAVAH